MPMGNQAQTHRLRDYLAFEISRENRRILKIRIFRLEIDGLEWPIHPQVTGINFELLGPSVTSTDRDTSPSVTFIWNKCRTWMELCKVRNLEGE